MSDKRPAALARARVLVVDADAARAAALAAALGEAAAPGTDVATAASGEAGWRRFAAQKPSIVIAALGGERGGAWFLRRIQTEYMGAMPAVYLLGEPGALAEAHGLEPDGVLLPPIARPALAAILGGAAATRESEARQALRLRELFELSLFGGQLSRNLEAVVRRAALSFRVDDCVAWTADGAVVNTRPLLDDERAALLTACRAAAHLGATLFTAPLGDGGALVVDGGGHAIAAVAFGPTEREGGLALIADGRRLTGDEREALALLGQRLGGELAWMAAHQRVIDEATALREAALLDPMLGVMNRTALEQALETELQVARRSKQPLALALIDLCGTRAINERHGHEVGDAVLAHLAQVLRRHLRAGDRVGRVGGDELGVLLVGATLDSARRAIENVLAALAAAPYVAGELEISIASAAGLTALRADGDRVDPAMSRARAALRRSRKAPGAIQIAQDDVESGEMIDLEAELGLPAGSILGGMYRILHELSRGAMGVVYRAEDLGLGRAVAIKLLRADLAKDRDLVARFRREAAMLAALRHRNLVQVHALAAVDDDVYFVMELVEGEPVSDVLARMERDGRAIDLDAIARVVEEIADALDAIHELGIVHRDVKPANVLLDRVNERAVLVDVGVARKRDEAVDAAGTPGYGAPECFLDVSESPASDVYGLAATTYAMLTGRQPYAGGDLEELVARQLSEPPVPPSRLRRELAPAVDAVLFKALAARPEDRFASAPAFAVALTRALAREPRERTAAAVAPATAVTAPLPPSGASLRRPTTRGPAGGVALSRGVFVRVAGRLLDRELGAAVLRRLGDAEPALARAASQTSAAGWRPLAELERLIAWTGAAGGDADAFARRIGRAAVGATLARHFGADPATLSPTALLKAAGTYWPRYHGWGELAVAEVSGGVEIALTPTPSTSIGELIAGMFERIAEMAGAGEVVCWARPHGGGVAFDVRWAG